MNTQNQRILFLIDRVNHAQATAQEIKELEIWYQSFDHEEKYTIYLNDEQKKILEENLFGRIENSIVSNLALHNPYPFKKYYKICAAAVLLIIGMSAFYFYQHHQPVKSITLSKNDEIIAVLPGGNKATLTLENGKTIVLDDIAQGNLAKLGTPNITKSSEGEIVYNPIGSAKEITYNTLNTPVGGQFKLILPDGTKVWLNASSSITYPIAFTGIKREVSITGEAYFEVAKNRNMPFHVKSTTQEITVLGTHFNVNCYADENSVKTTLLEGQVKVDKTTQDSRSKENDSEILQPGQQAILTNEGLKVKNVDAAQTVAWKNGFFHFEGTDLKELMRQFSRWYNIDIVYEGDIKNEKFFGKIERSYTLAEVLSILKLGNLHFKIENGQHKNERQQLIITP